MPDFHTLILIYIRDIDTHVTKRVVTQTVYCHDRSKYGIQSNEASIALQKY